MYPPPTSLIPVQIALIKFWETNSLGAIFKNFPYWYLGSTPYRYLTGPIIPLLARTLHQIFPARSLFEVYYWVILGFWLLGTAGVYFMAEELRTQGQKESVEKIKLNHQSLVISAFYFFNPLAWYLFLFSDGLNVISFSVLPWVWLTYLKFLDQKKRFNLVLVLLLVFVLWLDALALPTLFFGIVTVIIVKGWGRVEKRFKQIGQTLGISLIIASLWYGPGYWLVSLFGPSLGGQIRLGVIFQMGKLLPIALAIGMAVVSIKYFKRRSLTANFTLYWLSLFGFLTLMRFLSDPDFWQDWSSYYLEIQLGLAFFGGLVLERKLGGFTSKKRYFLQGGVFILLIFLWGLAVKNLVLNRFQKQIESSVEYKTGLVLTQLMKGQPTKQVASKVFLSGTTAFWLNAFFDLPQVRGGKDQGSVNPNWRKVVWEVREGEEAEESYRQLKQFGVSYLVVHTLASKEYYHDFADPQKFEGTPLFKKIYDQDGDRIYVLP